MNSPRISIFILHFISHSKVRSQCGYRVLNMNNAHWTWMTNIRNCANPVEKFSRSKLTDKICCLDIFCVSIIQCNDWIHIQISTFSIIQRITTARYIRITRSKHFEQHKIPVYHKMLVSETIHRPPRLNVHTKLIHKILNMKLL